MKIIIVEDETKTLQGIQKLIGGLSGKYQVIGTARSGEEGLNMARELQPDVVLTDIRMNGMSGLEMIQQLQKEELSCKFLILSGYADFQYAREALALGSVDYLLKPVTEEMLEQTLKKTADMIKDESVSIRIHTFSTEELLGRVLAGTGAEYESEFLSRFQEGSVKCLLLVRAESRMAQGNIKSILSAVREIFGGFDSYFCAMEENREIYMIMERNQMLRAQPLGQIQDDIYRRLDQAAVYCYQRVNEYLVFSAELFTDARNLNRIRMRIRDNSNWNLTFKRPLVIYGDRIKALSCSKFTYPVQLERAIVNRIRKGEIKGIEEDLNAFLDYLNDREYSYMDVREALVCLTAAILYTIRIASYGIYENIGHMNLMAWVQNALFTVRYKQVILNVLNEYGHYLENIKQSKHPIVNKVLKIIETEYAGDISQESVARRLNITPEYLSALFIRELGVKYSAYCTQCRIEAAKRMLEKEGKKIYEVAEKCGYSDVKYFCKVFKKYTGISPGEYQHKGI